MHCTALDVLKIICVILIRARFSSWKAYGQPNIAWVHYYLRPLH